MIELAAAEVVARTASDDVRVLHPITLRLCEPRIALVGPNGSGKSTLAKLLNGLIEPTAGSVRVWSGEGSPATRTEPDTAPGTAPGTEPPAKASPSMGTLSNPAEGRWLDTVRDGAAVRRTVGFTFTNPAAQLVMPTAIEDIALSLRRTHKNKTERLAAAQATLDRFGLGALADRSVHSLSGGQQQLLAIAGVLAAQPRILVADEPTTLLDLRNGRIISELLLGLPQQLIVATHDLPLARACDRVIVVMNGEVAFDSAAARVSAGAAVSWYEDHA